jgi:Spy/CpxP family protein refolding chaperone
MRTRSATALALASILVAGVARAQEQERTRLSPALEQMRETVCDRLESKADVLGLTPEQRDKIRQIHAGFAPKCQALRAARRELRQQEFQAISAVLTPPQREQMKDAVEERIETIQQGAPKPRGPEVVAMRNSVADRLEAEADELNLTDEQRTKIRESFQAFSQKYQDQRAEHRKLVEEELKAIGEVLTPEQRRMVRRHVEGRVVRAAASESVADRLRAAAEKLALTTEQREKIREAGRPYAEKFRELRRQRRTLLGDEMRAIAKDLTPEQREKVRDWREDRVVVVGVEFDPATPPHLAQLRETLADRLHAKADELGLTAEQRDKISAIRTEFAAKYQAQRAARRQLRQDEMKELGAFLTPEQREKIESFVEDREG